MSHQYAYTPYIWPSIIASILIIVLGVYSIKHRTVPAALPFAFACLFAFMWLLGSVLEDLALDAATKIFWFKFQIPWQLLAPMAITCFILDYTWPGRWLTRRNLILLSLIPLFLLLIIFTNDFHHLFWRGVRFEGVVVSIRGPLNIAFVVFGYLLGLFNFIILIWLFIQSSYNRWPVVIMLIGQIVARLFYLFEAIDHVRFNLPYTSIGLAFLSLMYAIVLFSFRILGPIPLARQAVIEQTPIGMLVLNIHDRIFSMNPAGERILQVDNKSAKGRHIVELLPAYAELQGFGSFANEAEFSIPQQSHLKAHGLSNKRGGAVPVSSQADQALRFYHLRISLLNDWRGLKVGSLLQLQDITEQKHTQNVIITQQRAMATLKERESLARELHDDLTQVLAFINTQGQTVGRLLDRNDLSTAKSHLERLVAVARAAEADIRESIRGMRLTISEKGLIATLEKYLEMYEQDYNIHTELIKSESFNENMLNNMVKVQLLQIIQEALTNARKHAAANQVGIQFDLQDHTICIRINDNGQGFDVNKGEMTSDGHFGLNIMRERADFIGGTIGVTSQPGHGTEVLIHVPADVTETTT